MRSKWAQKQTGFTIVELLIVIVVIAILAAITIVAYNGIQQRAHNTQTVAAAKQWKKLITLYVTQNGGYGAIRSGGHYCLGSGNPTNWDANPDEDCVATGSIKHPNATINTELASVGSFPEAPPVLNVGTGSRTGISFRQSDTLDPTGQNEANYPTLWYYLDGTSQDCVLRPVVRPQSGGVVIDSSATYTSNDGTTTVCRIAVPDPAAGS